MSENVNNKWYNSELKCLRKERDLSYQTFSCSTNSDDANIAWKCYQIARNKYQNKIRFFQNSYVQDKIEKCGSNQKEMWRVLKR